MLSDNVRILLKTQNKTQAELAKYVDVKQNTVSDWLNLGTSPKVSHIYRIAEFFNVSFDYLFTGKDAQSLETGETELVARYRSLDTDGQDMVRATVIGEMRRMEQQKPLEIAAGGGTGKTGSTQEKKVVSDKAPNPAAINRRKATHGTAQGNKKNA